MKRKLFLVLLFFSICAPYTLAADLSSTNFIVRDPVIGTGGGYYSSGSFQMFGTGHYNISGRSNSSSFFGRFGFEYFPEGISLTPTPTPVPTPTKPPISSGSKHVYVEQLCDRFADFNCDGAVDILDFSILIYYDQRTDVEIKKFDLNQDGIIDIRDISILFYYWTDLD